MHMEDRLGNVDTNAGNAHGICSSVGDPTLSVWRISAGVGGEGSIPLLTYHRHPHASDDR